VDKSVLTEHSHVERHGKVTNSIIGPNTGIGEGEVTACLVGPCVGFHHQSLLIAACWPEGKGNVGYGANVGSNHTSKAPDQELWPGEGTFFGLGVNIKYPADYSRAPYTIIATAVNALPQKVTFPFSLINAPGAVLPGISPAYNEIIPGWVLSDNIYTIRRNEGKYAARNRARRNRIVFEVLRPDIIDMMADAKERLQSTDGKDVYTEKNIKGLGKNYMLEASRLQGIGVYTFYLKYYALMGLFKKIKTMIASRKTVKESFLAKEEPGNLRWTHEQHIYRSELGNTGIVAGLRMLKGMQEEIARDVQASKEKDDVRGMRTIEDYADIHGKAENDSFVKQTWKETADLKKRIDKILEKLKK
jgi:hypothetical protein